MLPPRKRVLGLLLLSITAAAALALVIPLMAGSGFTVYPAGLRVRVYSFERPLMVLVASSIVLLYLGRTLSRFRRVALALLGTSTVLALIAYARQFPAFVTEGDIALLESYTMWATRGELFVGPYSRFGWNHPGPLYFYLQVPFHVLSGRLSVGLWAGALVINLASLLAIYWTAVRLGATRMAVVLAVVTVCYLWKVGEILPSPWNPHVIVLPLCTFILMAGAVASGSTRWLPLMVVPASLVTQTHVALVPTVLLISAAATLWGLWREVRVNGQGWPRLFRTLNLTAWVVLLLWILPLAQELHASPGNLSQIWTFFFTMPREGQPLSLAIDAWSEMLTGVLNPWLRVGWGTLFVPRGAAILRVAAVAQVVLLAIAAVHHGRSGRAFQSAIAVLLCMASSAAFWSVTRIEEQIMDHQLFWVSGLGALNVAVLLDAALGFMPRLSLLAREPAVVACALAWSFCAVVGLEFFQQRLARGPNPQERRTQHFISAVIEYMKSRQGMKPLIRIDQDAWPFVAGGVVELQKAGLPYAIEPDWQSMFSEAAAARGNEDAVLVYATKPWYDEIMSRPGRTLVAELDGTFVVLDTTKELMPD